MRFRCHPVRLVRYCLLIAGGLALLTAVWQYINGKPHSGKVIVCLHHTFFTYLLPTASYRQTYDTLWQSVVDKNDVTSSFTLARLLFNS